MYNIVKYFWIIEIYTKSMDLFFFVFHTQQRTFYRYILEFSKNNDFQKNVSVIAGKNTHPFQ